MKLLIQGDDFGFTKGITYGIKEAIEHGILTCTGLFTNMPAAELAAEIIKEHPDFCFGIDFNLVSGYPVSNPESIPHLLDSKGEFIRSGIRVKDPLYATEEGRRILFPEEEMRMEVRTQYEKYIALTGKQPSYFHPHSIMPETYIEAIRQLSKETGIPFSMDLWNAPQVRSNLRFLSMNKKEFNPTDQLNKNTVQDFLDNEQYYLEGEIAVYVCHPGYPDAELLGLSSLSLERMKDLDFMLSSQMKEWIKNHEVQLISYHDWRNDD